MAKLRQNHNRTRGFGKNAVRIVIILVILAALLVFLPFFLANNSTSEVSDSPLDTAKEPSERFYLPNGSKGQIIHHAHYSLAYNEDREQADWVAYPLTRKELAEKNVKRTDWFEQDKKVIGKSAHHGDYKGSGYTRGHMAPAGDMAFSLTAMEQSFLMSNMSPQIRTFNNGIWRELEENVRDWAYKAGEVYLVSGPIFDKNPKEIGRSRVDVPSHFYKIILDIESKQQKAVAFLIPHETSDKHLRDYSVSIDEIESLTGFDFFHNLLSEEEEASLEAMNNPSAWKVDESKFQQRLKHWNNQ